MVKSKDVMHVELEEPVDLRKDILKTAIDITKVQKTFQDLKKKKLEKEHYKKELKKIFNLLKSEIVKLEELLPEIKIEKTKSEKPKEEKMKVITKKDLSKEKIIKIQKTDKFSSEIEELNKKLRNL